MFSKKQLADKRWFLRVTLEWCQYSDKVDKLHLLHLQLFSGFLSEKGKLEAPVQLQ